MWRSETGRDRHHDDVDEVLGHAEAVPAVRCDQRDARLTTRQPGEDLESGVSALAHYSLTRRAAAASKRICGGGPESSAVEGPRRSRSARARSPSDAAAAAGEQRHEQGTAMRSSCLSAIGELFAALASALLAPLRDRELGRDVGVLDQERARVVNRLAHGHACRSSRAHRAVLP